MAEPYLGNPIRCEAVLNKFGFSFRKRFGQNFLIDEDVLTGIVESSEVTDRDIVLEIGPGIGSLTQYLASRAEKVISVEIDRSLLPLLDYTLADWDNVTIINQDILKTDIKALSEENGGRPFKVVANLPYYITTPILMNLLEADLPITSITVMIQREVADRIKTGPGSKDYGALSVAVQYYAEPEAVIEVDRTSFYPSPNVDSTVLRLLPYPEKPYKAKNEKTFFGLIRAVFNQRRKTLVNALSNSPELGISKDEVRSLLSKMGLPETTRGETFDLETFVNFANLMEERL